MRLRDILQGEFVVIGEDDREIGGISYDSRAVKSGDVFVALKGEHFDGHDFIRDAIERGATAIVYERDRPNYVVGSNALDDITWVGVTDSRRSLASIAHHFYRKPSEDLTVIGITGTNGKTTTSYLVKSIFEQSGKKAGLIGTITYLIGDTAYDAPHTTPEAPQFQGLLREMADNGCSHVVAEISSHALSQKRVDYTHFAGAIFTNLTRDHLDYHITMEDYFEAKQRLFTELLADNGTAVINYDDPYGRQLKSALGTRGTRVFTYAVGDKHADVTAQKISMSCEGSRFELVIGTEESINIMLPLAGLKNISNALAAAALALSFGIPLQIIKKGIERVAVVTGRFEKLDTGQDYLAIVDYAHTEDALEGLLFSVRQLLDEGSLPKGRNLSVAAPGDKGRIITVFGCGGDRDKGKRPEMGKTTVKMSDLVILTSDNPRGEDPREIIRDIERGINSDNYCIIPDREAAISVAVELASPGDAVVIAGKGHEDYQEIKGVRYSFSDRLVLEQAIRRRKHAPLRGTRKEPL